MTNSTARILAIARLFPVLRSPLSDYNPTEFDPANFKRMTAGWSTTEKDMAYFVLNIWNPWWAQKNGCRFNLAEVSRRLDDENRAALAKWVEHPVYP